MDSYAVYRAPYTSTLDNDQNVISIENQNIPVNGFCLDCELEMAAIDFDLNGDDELAFLDGDGINIYDYVNSSNGYIFERVFNYSFSGKFRVGDFTGDQIPDILLIGDDIQILVGSYNGAGYINFTPDSHLLALAGNNDFKTVADINGDQILEIITNNNFNFSINTFSQSEGFKLRNSYLVSLATSGNMAYFADANGDNKTDIIYFENGKKYVHFSHGYDFYFDPGNFEKMAIPYIVEDLNNDGRVDFLFIQIGVDSTKFEIRYTCSNGITSTLRKSKFNFNTTLFENYYDCCIGDFDANGTKDILLGVYETIPIDQLEYLRLHLYTIHDQGISKNIITGITDGHNVSRVINYQTNPKIKFLNADFPISKFRNKEPIVYESYITGSYNLSNVEKKWDWKKYSFSKPLIHESGKGFLGFKEKSITTYSNTTLTEKAIVNKSIDSLFSESGKYYYMFPYTSITSVGDTVISITTNKFGIKQTHANTLCFLPVITQSATLSYEKNASHTYKGIQVFKQSIINIDPYGNSTQNETIMDEYAMEPETTNYSWKKTQITTYNNIESEWLICRPIVSELISYHKPEESATLSEYRTLTKFHYFDGIEEPANFVQYIEVLPNLNTLLESETWFTYDIFGNVKSKKVKALIEGVTKERTVEYEYKSDLAYEGRFLTTEIARADNPEEDIVKRYDYYLSSGLLKSTTFEDKNNLTSTFIYDKFGKLIKTINPDNTAEEIVYGWAFDNNHEMAVPDSALYYKLCYKTNASEEKWYKLYNFFDKYGRNICTFEYGLKGNINTIINKFDGFGRIYGTSDPQRVSSINPLFNYVSYDLLGRVVSQKLSTGVEISTSYMGRKTRVNNNSTNIWKETTFNAIGLKDVITEPANGFINYNYDATGKVRAIYSQNSPTYYEYDDAGNNIKIVDPDAGVMSYSYNAFGELLTQTDDKNAYSIFLYDNFGRLVVKDNVSENESTNYYYINNKLTNGFGQVGRIEKHNSNSIISTSFAYDSLNRLVARTESIGGKNFNFKYEYNQTTGNIYSYEYPSGLKLLYSYDQFGYLNQIRNQANDKTLWEAMNANSRGQLTQLLYGANMTVNNQFDTFGFLTRISTNRVYHGTDQVIQDLTFNFDPATGNLLKRTDETQNLTETFGYDIDLKSRLTSWQVGAE